MKKYFFTFGQDHYTLEGVHMRDRWVCLSAPDYEAAREHFCEHFAKPFMGRADKWAFQYEEKGFGHTRYMFPEGEYKFLSVSPAPVIYKDVEYTPEQVKAMRDWVNEIQWSQMDITPEEHTDLQVTQAVERHCEGGIAAFLLAEDPAITEHNKALRDWTQMDTSHD